MCIRDRCSFASGTSVVIARRAGSGMGGTYFSIVHLIGLTATSVCRGRLEPSVVLWCVILPLIAVLGGRPRKAVLWAVLSVVMVVGLAIAEPRGWLAAPVRQTASGFMMSTVGLIVGGALAATGVVLVIVDGSEAAPTATTRRVAPRAAVGVGPRGLLVRGSF